MKLIAQENSSSTGGGKLGSLVVVLEGFGLHKVNQAAEGVEFMLELAFLRKPQLVSRLAISVLRDVGSKAVVLRRVVPKACGQPRLSK